MDALTKPRRKTSFGAKPKRPYPDLHDHVRALEQAGQLVRVDRPINFSAASTNRFPIPYSRFPTTAPRQAGRRAAGGVRQ